MKREIIIKQINWKVGNTFVNNKVHVKINALDLMNMHNT